MIRRRSVPWIHRWSRPIMGGISIIGALVTAYLTYEKLMGNAAGACSAQGCDIVLNSPYATIFGVPLTLFGLLGYVSMAAFALVPLAINPDNQKKLRDRWEQWTGLLLFVGGTSMAMFSGYLMYVLAFKIQAVCPYCITSALFSLSLFVLAIVGRAWEDVGQLAFTGVAVALVTLVGTLGVYANVGEGGTTISGSANVQLARHLTETRAQMFGAYWCPHCIDQKEMFGKEAFKLVDYVECDPKGKNQRAQLCKAENIKGFPTWKIDGQLYEGEKDLQKLADLSNYKGPRNFEATESP
jgi:uncharacterized membrane protein/glutaredoxin